jgi:RNA polymerase sigma factor (sigma-70 family)
MDTNEKRLNNLSKIITEETRKLKFRLKTIYYLDDDVIEDGIEKGLEKLWTLRRNLLERDDISDSLKYITAIAKNFLLDQVRRSKKYVPIDKNLSETLSVPAKEVHGKQIDSKINPEFAKVEKIIETILTPRQREILQYKIFDNRSYSDIALELNISKGTVKATYNQVINKLKKFLDLKK